MTNRLFLLLDIVLIVVIGPSCALDVPMSLVSTSVHAQVIDTESKTCKRAIDCTVINQDCCGQESGLLVINSRSATRLVRRVTADCKAKASSAEAGGLCKGIKPHPRSKYPKVACEGGMCVMKAPKDVDKTACTYDAQCELFDPDCCDSKENLTAINFKFGAMERSKKFKECREKLKADKRMCKGEQKLRPQTKSAACVEGRCVVK